MATRHRAALQKFRSALALSLKSALALSLSLLFLAAPAFALQADEILADPEAEARARAISREVRCVVCQSESIDDSPASLARDLRLLVRQRILAGDDNGEVLAYLRDRYGDNVLLRPPVQQNTWLLWLTPILALLMGVLLLRGFYKPKAKMDLGQTEKSELEN